MCTYNGEKFIGEQLESILNQTYPVSEIVIKDDCSTDSTWDIIMDYSSKYPSVIKPYRNERNQGPHINFLTAFELSTGDIIAPSDQDDIWAINKIELLISILIKDEKYDLSFAQDTSLFENGTETFFNQMIEPIEKNIYGNHLYGHSTLFKRKLLEIYEDVNSISFDLTLSMYCSINNNFVSTDERLVIWRRHEEACTKASLLDYKKPVLNKYRKVLFTLLNVSNLKSAAIKRIFEGRSKFVRKFAKSEIDILSSEIASCIANQTRLSLIKAGLKHVKILKLRNEYQHLSLKIKIASMLFAFRTPFVWWYDWHQEKYFE